MKKIVIDKEKCIGCFKCKKVCYSVFEVGPDGKSKVRYGISEADIEDAERAVICCPTGAINIVENYRQKSTGSFANTLLSILSWANDSDDE